MDIIPPMMNQGGRATEHAAVGTPPPLLLLLNNNNKQLRCGNRNERAARSKRPNTPSDGSGKHNGFQTTNLAVLIPKHVSRQDRAHDQEHHPLLHRLQWHGKQWRIPRAGDVQEPCKGPNHRGIYATRPNHHAHILVLLSCGLQITTYKQNKTNKNLRCGNRKGLLSRNDQTHHRMGPKTMESIPPSKRNTQTDIQLRTRQIVAPANKSTAGD